MPTVGPWFLEQELSRGGFGAVWRARDAHGRTAALKLVSLTGAADEVTRFLREVEALRRLRHPGVVGILDAGVDQGRPWLAMELIEGESLEQRLRRGPLPPAEAVGLVAQLSEALAAVHGLGLLHRDLKPANAIVERGTGRVVLVDFGLSRHMFDTGRLTRTGEALGTPAYMAPEQVTAERDQGPAVDVWGLGATLYALLTGGLPFPGATPTQVMARILEEEPAPPSRVAAGITPALDELVRRCLAKRPAERPPTAAALSAALRDPRLLQAPRARSLPRVVAASLVLAGLGLAGAILLGGARPDPPPSPPLPQPLPPPPAPPPTPAVQRLVLQPGPLEGKDTYVTNYGMRLNDNYGTAGGLVVGDVITRTERYTQQGDYRTLISFSLRRLPPAARVASARLELYQPARTVRPGVVDARVHLVQEPWVEGTGTCDSALDGVAWQGRVLGLRVRAAESDRPDLDQPAFDPTPLDEVAIPVEREGWFVFDVTRAVERWQQSPADNHGLCLAHAAEGPPYDDLGASFYSSDWWQAERRPRLVIEYEGPPPLPAAEDNAAARRAQAREILERCEGRLQDLETLQLISGACAVAPEWATPFLMRTWAALQRVDGSLAPPNPEAACEELKTALARQIEPDELVLVRRVIEEILAATVETRADDLDPQGRLRFASLTFSHVNMACPTVREDPQVRALLTPHGFGW